VVNILEKLQSLPENKRRIILWSIVIILSLGLFFAWLQILKQKLSQIEKEKIKEGLGIPQIQEKLKEMPKIEIPKIEIPEISEEELKQH